MAKMTTLDRVHRLSPWWVLAVYAVIAWLLIQIVQAAAATLDLPPWVPTVAWVLLLIGLPVVAVTSFIQHSGAANAATDRTPTTGGDEDGDTIRSVFTWSNTLVGGLGGFLALGLSAVAWILSGPDVAATDLAIAGVDGRSINEASATAEASEAFRGLGRAIQAMDIEGTLAFYDDEPGFTHIFDMEMVEGRAPFDAKIRSSFAGLREIPVWEIEELRATQLEPNTVLVVAQIREVAVDTAGVSQTIEAVFSNVFVRRANGWRVSHGQVTSHVVEDATP